MLTLASHHYYQQNNHGRDFFVGDIHGKYRLLIRALARVNFDSHVDRLFSVGDLIDRGEASFNCLLLARNNWFIPVLGNHEQFLAEVKSKGIEHKFIWYYNGGSWWEALTDKAKALAQDIISTHFALTLSVDTLAGRVGVVHAQYPPVSWPLTQQKINKTLLYELLWSREYVRSGRADRVKGVDFIVSGHTPLNMPLLINRQLFIDTGCGHLANQTNPLPRLTICEFSERYINLYGVSEQGEQFSRIAIV